MIENLETKWKRFEIVAIEIKSMQLSDFPRNSRNKKKTEKAYIMQEHFRRSMNFGNCKGNPERKWEMR